MYMYICVYICKYLYIYVYVNIRMYISAYILTYIYIHICLHMYMYICVYICKYLYVCIYIYIFVCLFEAVPETFRSPCNSFYAHLNKRHTASRGCAPRKSGLALFAFVFVFAFFGLSTPRSQEPSLGWGSSTPKAWVPKALALKSPASRVFRA